MPGYSSRWKKDWRTLFAARSLSLHRDIDIEMHFLSTRKTSSTTRRDEHTGPSVRRGVLERGAWPVGVAAQFHTGRV